MNVELELKIGGKLTLDAQRVTGIRQWGTYDDRLYCDVTLDDRDRIEVWGSFDDVMRIVSERPVRGRKLTLTERIRGVRK